MKRISNAINDEYFDSYSDEDYDKFYLEADDGCFCGHLRSSHNYNPTDKICSDSFCNECNCKSCNLATEFILPIKRLFWKLFKGYKTPMILVITRKLKPFTKEEIETIRKEFCSN